MSEKGTGSTSASGVFLYDEFRDNLIIDRYDPSFTRMRGSKLSQLRSENSEDALTWNVFRSLRQIEATHWLPLLSEVSFGTQLVVNPRELAVELWVSVPPPPALRRYQNDEGDSEIDVRLETPDFVWFIEAKYKSDISTKTSANPRRNQVLRNIDVGSYYAGTRDFYFSLLALDSTRSRKGVAVTQMYSEFAHRIPEQLEHRKDACANLKGIGVLTWADCARALEACSKTANREEERQFALRALEWMRSRGVAYADTQAN
jgi:hypothetical protein